MIDDLKFQTIGLLQNCNDPIVIKNCNELLQRSIVGQKKYGMTLGDNRMPQEDRLQYTLEELLDASNYIQKLLSMYPDKGNTKNPGKQSKNTI